MSSDMDIDSKVRKGMFRIAKIVESFDTVLKMLFELGIAPNSKKTFSHYFTHGETAEMVGRSRTTVNKLIEELRIEQDQHTPKSGYIGDKKPRTLGLRLDQVNLIRDHLGIRPIRNEGDKVPRIAIQNFKGGTAKSTTTVHFAQYLALQGYRVLVLDGDPQATATAAFGYIPDQEFDQNNTMWSVIMGEKLAREVVVKTYFPGIDLIPSCLAAYETEFSLVFAIADADAKNDVERKLSYYWEIDSLLKDVEEDYDVILLDSPPALSIMSLNILCAATGIFVPVPPAQYDFMSTGQYFRMVDRMVGGIASEKEWDFIKILPTKVDRGKKRQVDFVGILRQTFGANITNAVMLATSNIPNAAASFNTAYEMKGRERDKDVIEMLDTVFKEMEQEVLKSMPSRAEELRKKGVI